MSYCGPDLKRQRPTRLDPSNPHGCWISLHIHLCRVLAAVCSTIPSGTLPKLLEAIVEKNTEYSQKLLSERDAADILRVSQSWLQKKRVYGGGPDFIKVGRSVRYQLSDLKIYIEQQRRTSTCDVSSSDGGRHV